MNLVKTENLTMDSLEIARLTNKEHRNVTRDIEKMFEELEIDVLKFEHIYLDSQNRKQKKYSLTKDLTLTLISGYSIKLRKAIIDRWQELENQNNKPKTFEEIMKDALLLADQRVKQLEAQIEEDKPKVNFADAV
jgi:possible bacteriophage antirepressor